MFSGALGASLMSGGFEAEAAKLFARFTTAPTGARKTLINNLIRSLKQAGIWSKLDAFYVMAAADAQAAQRNWIADAYNLTPTNSPTFTADQGYQGNGTSSYLATGFTPSSAPSPKLVQNSASLGVWSRTNIAENAVDIGAKGSNPGTQDSTIMIRNSSNQFLNRLNIIAGGGYSPANASSVGLFVAVRPDASNLIDYVNGAVIGTGAVASAVVATIEFNIGVRNDNGTFNAYSTKQYAAALIGSSLSAAENSALYAALNTYLTAVGAA
jgi:hypothetical protein